MVMLAISVRIGNIYYEIKIREKIYMIGWGSGNLQTVDGNKQDH